MTDAIHAVKSEGEREGTLEEDLGGDGESGESGGQGGRLEVPAEQGGSEVSSGEEIHTTGEGETGDTVESGGVPGDLGTVDGQVGRDGAVETLLRKDLGGIFRVGGGRGLSGGCP